MHLSSNGLPQMFLAKTSARYPSFHDEADARLGDWIVEERRKRGGGWSECRRTEPERWAEGAARNPRRSRLSRPTDGPRSYRARGGIARREMRCETCVVRLSASRTVQARRCS